MDAINALIRLGGIASAADIARLSSRRQLRTAVRRELVVHLARDSYALPTADAARREATRLGGVVSHLSAAAYWEWETAAPPELPQICVPRGRKLDPRRRAGAEVRWRKLSPQERAGGVTGRVRTVLDCARDLSFPESLAVADSALRSRHVSKEQLEDGVSDRRGPGSIQVRRVVAAADERAANAFESVLRALALDAGLSVVPQQPVELSDRTVHPDLRFTRDQVMEQPDAVTESLLAARHLA